MVAKHAKYIEQAAKQGAQVMCLQELFYGPYFCQVQDTKHYSYTEKIPDGPTTKLMQELAKKHGMVLIVPMYEEDQVGVYYNTAAVIDAYGKYLGKYRKTHIPHVNGFWEKFYFRPGNMGYPVFDTAVGKVVGYIPRTVNAPVVHRADRARDRQRLLGRDDQPRRPGEGVRTERLLRIVIFRRSARKDHRAGLGKG